MDTGDRSKHVSVGVRSAHVAASSEIRLRNDEDQNGHPHSQIEGISSVIYSSSL